MSGEIEFVVGRCFGVDMNLVKRTMLALMMEDAKDWRRLPSIASHV